MNKDAQLLSAIRTLYQTIRELKSATNVVVNARAQLQNYPTAANDSKRVAAEENYRSACAAFAEALNAYRLQNPIV